MCPSSTSSSERSGPQDLAPAVGVTGPRTSALVAWAFIGVLCATAAIDAVAPLAPPKLLGLEAARAEEARASARWADGSRARLPEREGQMTSRVRAALGPALAPFALGVLRQAPERVRCHCLRFTSVRRGYVCFGEQPRLFCV